MIRRLAGLYAALVLAFLLLPMLVVLPLGLTAGEILGFPLPGLSLRWWAVFLSDARWAAALANSLWVGLVTMLLASCLGGAAALALWQGRFRGRGLLLGLFTLPIAVPGVVAALAFYIAFSAVGLANSFAGLVLAHTVLAAPFVVVTVLAQLRLLDPGLLRAAASLGARPWQVLRRVLLPLMAPGLANGAIFAFATSFDELMAALFLTAPGQATLPRQIYAGLREELSPAIAAAASFVILLSVLLLAACEIMRRRR